MSDKPAPARPGGMPQRGPFGQMGPPQKAKSFGPSARRLLGLLAPERAKLVFVIILAISSIALSVSGPRV